MVEILPLLLFLAICLVLIMGYPVAFSLAGTSLVFAGIAYMFGHFDMDYLMAVPSRVFGIMTNQTLLAVPLFIIMGVFLEKSQIAEKLLDALSLIFGQLRGGLAIAVILVGMLLAASTGVIGATVVTLGLLALPTMLKRGYDPSLSTGLLASVGTLGQIIPPSIALVLLGDVISTAYQQAQISSGIYNPRAVSVGDLFLGAIVPGLILVVFYIIYVVVRSAINPKLAPKVDKEVLRQEYKIEGSLFWRLLRALVPPILLIFAVLGSILGGFATPTEASSVGALGALLLTAFNGKLNLNILREVMQTSTKITGMVFLILMGAAVFSLVFRGLGGDEMVGNFFSSMPNVFIATLIVMIVIFLLGFILDFIEITFVVVPIVAPVLLAMGLDPIWLGIMIAVNLQTSFLTPPFGFALFYLRGVTHGSVETTTIYKGVVPFVLIQLLLLIILAIFPELTTWLPLKFLN